MSQQEPKKVYELILVKKDFVIKSDRFQYGYLEEWTDSPYGHMGTVITPQPLDPDEAGEYGASNDPTRNEAMFAVVFAGAPKFLENGSVDRQEVVAMRLVGSGPAYQFGEAISFSLGVGDESFVSEVTYVGTIDTSDI